MQNTNNNELIIEDAKKFLRDSNIAVIATSVDNIPHASTIYYYMYDSFNFYFYTKENTTKSKNIKRNSNVSLIIGTGPEHITIKTQGEAFEITEADEKEILFDKLIETSKSMGVKMWPTEDMNKLKGQNNMIFKFVPDKMFFMNLDSMKYPNSISENYHEIPLS